MAARCTKEKRQAQAKTARRPRDGDAESGHPGLEKDGQESRGVVKDGGRG